MPKKEKPLKKPVPVKELQSTPFTEVIELERIVTPDEDKRVDHIFAVSYTHLTLPTKRIV